MSETAWKRLWESYLTDTCYTYALNLFIGERRYVGDLTLGQRVATSVSNDQLLRLLHLELEQAGLSPKTVSEDAPLPPDRRRICIVRKSDNVGYYHFYRQDADGIWSHKVPGQMPTQKGRTGNLIHRVQMEAEDGYLVLEFISVAADSTLALLRQ